MIINTKRKHERVKRKEGDIPFALFRAAGLMVPEPSTKSPPSPFIGAETEWEPYMAGQGGTGGG
jgi:hypothetical protein